MTTEWKVGDRLRILNRTMISGGYALIDGVAYDVKRVDNGGMLTLDGGIYGGISIYPFEMQYVERVADDEEDTERNAELGEPSADCNCVTLTEIYEEVLDMKAMIGRLIRNGGDEE